MKKIFFISSTILFLSFLLVVGGIKAGSENNVSGWAWTETTGWISFNNISGGGTINYGVGVETSNGFLSGYAWSENIGWIKMDPESPYPGSPGHSAKLNLNTKEFSGWARACAGSPNGDCTGGVGPGVNTGGWDGWIKLDGATLDTIPQPNEFDLMICPLKP